MSMNINRYFTRDGPKVLSLTKISVLPLQPKDDEKIIPENVPEEKALPNSSSVEASLNPNVPEFVPSFVSVNPQTTSKNEEQVVEGKPDEPENWVEVGSVNIKFKLEQEEVFKIASLIYR